MADFIGTFVQSLIGRAADSAIDNMFGGSHYGQVLSPDLPTGKVAAPPVTQTSRDSLVEQQLLGAAEEFAKGDGPQHYEFGGFIQDPLLAKLASGEPLEPIDFMGV